MQLYRTYLPLYINIFFNLYIFFLNLLPNNLVNNFLGSVYKSLKCQNFYKDILFFKQFYRL